MSIAGTAALDAVRAPNARNIGEAAGAVLGSTAGGAGDTAARDGAGVCPIDASEGESGASGGIDDRRVRPAFTAENCEDAPGTGVGLRYPGIGVGLRATDVGCGVARMSGGGIVDLRVDETVDGTVDGTADGGSGVVRFSGGGIVDLRVDTGVAEGGNGVSRFSDGGAADLRDAGNSVARAAPTSSSLASGVSPLRGSTAGVLIEERRDEPRAELCGGAPSDDVFPIVTLLTLVHFSQRVIRSRQESSVPRPRDNHAIDISGAHRLAKTEITSQFGIL